MWAHWRISSFRDLVETIRKDVREAKRDIQGIRAQREVQTGMMGEMRQKLEQQSSGPEIADMAARRVVELIMPALVSRGNEVQVMTGGLRTGNETSIHGMVAGSSISDGNLDELRRQLELEREKVQRLELQVAAKERPT